MTDDLPTVRLRIAIVSPYSWSYPGGVTRHIDTLARHLISLGHAVNVLSPVDPPGPLSRLLHRGSPPQAEALPTYLLPLGRTVGLPANGSMSSLMLSPRGMVRLGHELARGSYDVVHVHEPDAPAVGWLALLVARVPLVGTFHTYNEHRYSHALATALGVRLVLNHLHVRVAVSTAAEWTAARFFGGRYRVIPNGVELSPLGTRAEATDGPRVFRVLFIGAPVERKGLPFLLRAFAALHERTACELTLIGPSGADLSIPETELGWARALGKVDDRCKREELARADLLCAPSLHGESFGMVLTEAFATGTPVVASDIPGYREIVRDGVNGLLVPPGDPQALAEALYCLATDEGRREAMSRQAAASAQYYAWPRVVSSVLEAYGDAIAAPKPSTASQRLAVHVGAVPADLQPRLPARRLEPLQPAGAGSGLQTSRWHVALSGAVLVGVALLCWLSLRKVGVGAVTAALGHTRPGWAVLAVVLMSAAMVLRAVSWYTALQAALAPDRIRFLAVLRGLCIGVLVSSTLPANLGEPARALVVVRHTQRRWDNLPTIAGTVLSQSLLNIAGVVALGLITLASPALGIASRDAIAVGAAVAVLVVVAILIAPALLGRWQRSSRLRQLSALAARLRQGLNGFRHIRSALTMAGAQFGAWALQWLAVWALLVATQLDHRSGVLAAAAVLCAVNVTMAVPVTPGDIGVFQAVVAAVLHAGWHVPYSDAIAYGVLLQAAELLTALLMGVPAMLREGLSFRHLRSSAQSVVPIKLPDAAPAEVTGCR